MAPSPDPRHASGGARPPAADDAPADDARAPDDLEVLVSALAHELKTPTAIILGLAERLRDGRSLLPSDRRAVERILVNARLAQTYVQAMEGTARLAHLGGPTPTAPSDIARTVRYTAQDFAFVAERSGLHLYVDTPQHLRAAIDPTHVGIVVSNLLVNAIRATPEGGTVRCTLQATADVVLLEVADSGPGIPPAERARVLTPFVGGAHAGDDVGGRGLGLGLAIVSGVAAAYGGTVRIGDAPEGGACVGATFRLTDGAGAAPPPAAAPGAVRAVREPSRRASGDAPLVAVVCDDVVRARLRRDELRREGDREVVLHDPAWGPPTALAPDAVVFDVQATSPVEAVRAIRAEPRHDDLPLMALVPVERPELRVELLRLGADEVCVAPQSPAELRARVDRLIARRRRETERRRAAGRHRRAFHDAAIGMGIASADGRWREVNAALCALTGVAAGELLRLRVDEFDHEDDRAAGAAALRELLAGTSRGFQVEKRWRVAGGRTRWVRLSVTVERDDRGEPAGFLVQAEDVTGRHRREDRLQHLADRDPLTGVLNRRGFDRVLRDRAARDDARRRADAVLLVRLDGLAAVNRAHGHLAGDRALRAAARALRDGVAAGTPVARVGGDEFAVLLDGPADGRVDGLAGALTTALVRVLPAGPPLTPVVRARTVPAAGLRGVDDARERADAAVPAGQEPAPSAPGASPRPAAGPGR